MTAVANNLDHSQLGFGSTMRSRSRDRKDGKLYFVEKHILEKYLKALDITLSIRWYKRNLNVHQSFHKNKTNDTAIHL